MNLVLYYFVHTFKNSIKKLFKTWVAIFMIVIILFGVIVGVLATVFDDDGEDKATQPEPPQVVEEQKPEENNMSRDDVMAIVEMVAGGVVILLVMMSIAGGEKSGSKIFRMPDVNFLFPAPKKPQSVLMFRVVLQMGLMFVSTIYMAFQLPNLIFNLGLIAWLIVLVINQLVSVCTYTIVATHKRLQKFIRPFIYTFLGSLAVTFYALISIGGMEKFSALKLMFASKNTRFVPIWGWVRGFVMSSIDGNALATLIYLACIILACAVFIYIIWHIKADFYEDAMTGAAQMQEKITAMTEGRAGALKRSKKIKSGEIGRGEGANAFLYKFLYNRKRKARFGFLTKTLESYLAICVGVALVTRLVIKTDNIMPLSLVMLYIIFFRSFGNPIGEEASKNYLFLVPESPFKKLFYTLIGGTLDSVLNILPTYFLGVIIIGGNIQTAILFFFVFISFDFLTSCTALIIDMILPTYIAPAIRSMMLIMLNMLSLMIIGGIVGIIGHNSSVLEALIFAVILCVSLGIGFCYLSQRLLHKGRN